MSESMALNFVDSWMSDFVLDGAGRVFMIVCLAVLGAILGSFMNVVVYRLPRQMSLSRPGSRCPVCEHPIRWHDNVPVLGWLALGGRCRDCKTWISPRYPLVEALVAAIGGCLAAHAISPLLVDPNGIDETMYEVDLVAFAFRLLLSCTLVCAAMIEVDDLVPPRRLLVGPFVVGAIMLLLWPRLLPESPLVGRDGLAAALVAMSVALVLGAAAWPAWTAGEAVRRVAFASVSLGELMLVAMFLGERAICAIGPASLAVYVVTRLVGRKWPRAARCGWGAALVTMTVVWMMLSGRALLPERVMSGSPVVATLVAGSVMFFLANALRLASGPRLRPGT